jgi:hypothetical protein
MKKIFLIFIILFLSACSSKNAILFLHKTEKDDGDIFTSDPKYDFFNNSYYFNDIYRYKVKFTKREIQEIKRIIDSVKKQPELTKEEREEGPTDFGLIINNDTIFGYAGNIYWKKKAFHTGDGIIQKKIKELNKKEILPSN